jgi:hypothetical protein
MAYLTRVNVTNGFYPDFSLNFNLIAALAGSIRSVLSQEIVAPRWRGATSAFLFLGLALGWGSMVLLGSAIIGMIHFSGLMYISALSGLLSVALIFAYVRLRSARTLAPVHSNFQIQSPTTSPEP